MVDGIERMFANGTGRSFVVFEVNHSSHTITFDYEGCDIPMNDLWRLCLTDSDLREEMEWGMTASRSNPARIITHDGESGCIRLELWVENNNHYDGLRKYFKGSKVAAMHISMLEKVAPKFEMWSGDLALLMFYYRNFYFRGHNCVVFPGYCNGQDRMRKVKKSKNIKYINLFNNEICGLDVNLLQEKFRRNSAGIGTNPPRDDRRRRPRRTRPM